MRKTMQSEEPRTEKKEAAGRARPTEAAESEEPGFPPTRKSDPDREESLRVKRAAAPSSQTGAARELPEGCSFHFFLSHYQATGGERKS